MPGDRSILRSGRAEQAHVTAEGWRGRLPSPPLECSGPQAVELRRDSASSARHRARRVCRRAGDERACGVDVRCPETVFRWSTPTSTGRSTRTPGGRNGRHIVEDLVVRVGELGAPPARSRACRTRARRTRALLFALRAVSPSRSRCRPASGTVGPPVSPSPQRLRRLAGQHIAGRSATGLTATSRLSAAVPATPFRLGLRTPRTRQGSLGPSKAVRPRPRPLRQL